MSELTERLRNRVHDSQMDNELMMDDAIEALEAQKTLIKDLADCLEDMTKHYVEVRNDLYGLEAAEEIEVIAAGKLISKALSSQPQKGE